MIKLISLVRRPKEWSREQLNEWWRGPHANSAKKLPGLLGYTHGDIKIDFDNPDSPEPAWDGLAELYFKDKAALDKAFASKEWKDAVKETAGMGGKRIVLVADEIDLLASSPNTPTIPPRPAGSQESNPILDSFSLQDRNALIIGGHGGLGEIIARTLAQLGAHVALAARHKEKCVSLAAELENTYGVRAMGLGCDITEEKQVEKTVAATVERFGSLEILVNNAGAFWTGPPEQIELSGWEKVVKVNLTGIFLACRTAAREMIKKGAGTIINVASNGGLMSFQPEFSEVVPYTTTKGAMIKLTRDLAVSWAKKGIRVNAVAPGQLKAGFTESISTEQKAEMCKRIPLGRLGEPDELSGAIAFLASDASKYIIGHTLVLDGGWTLE